MDAKIYTILSSFLFRGYVAYGYLCEEGGIDCHSLEFTAKKSELGTETLFGSEKFDMIDNNVCRSEFGDQPSLERRSTCSNQANLSSPNGAWGAFKERNCFCDENCHIYHDCCVDYALQSDVGSSKEKTCRKLPNSNYYIYTIQRCPVEWEGDFVQSLCEEEAASLQKEGKYFTHLQNVPVHSKRTNLMYRNVFCAVCSGDTDLTTWKTYVHCSGHTSHYNMEMIDTQIDLTTNATYNPLKNRWRVQVGNHTKFCRLVISEFLNWKGLSGVYQARRCKPAINTCPVGTESYQLQKCQEYTSFVYEKRPFSGKLKAIYKNFHCALCNKVDVEFVTCFDPTLLPLNTVFDPEAAYFDLLFDFNFAEGQDNQIETSYSNCSLSLGRIWDPLLRTCQDFPCGKAFRREDGKCVRLEKDRGNSSKTPEDSECTKMILTSDMFVMMENNSIFANYSKRFYREGQYEVHKEGNGTLFEILVCAESEKEVFSVLRWLTEITLFLFRLVAWSSTL